MLKRLIIIMFTLGAHNVPAHAASPSPFAVDAAGRPVLEFHPATAVKFNAQGRDLVSVTVTETPNDARGSSNLALIVDCRLRQLAASPMTDVAKDGMPPTSVAGFKTSDLKSPPIGMYQRFVTALCEGELLGMQGLPAKSGWKHFLESPVRGLYVASVRTIGKYRAASVRLYEFGGAQLADGRHIDARDAVWVIDCERKLGAVAFERAFVRVGDQNQTVQAVGDERAFADPSIVEVDKLTFGQPAAGSMQARFGDASCVMHPDLQ